MMYGFIHLLKFRDIVLLIIFLRLIVSDQLVGIYSLISTM